VKDQGSKRLAVLPERRASNCFSCQARERSAWCELVDDDVRLLNDCKVSNIYQPGQVIFYQGNPCLGLYCLEEGTVAVRKNDQSGNSVLIRVASAGDTLGYRTYFSGGPYAASAEALEPARVCFVDRGAIDRLLEQNPNLGTRFLKRMAEALGEAQETQLQSATLPVRARLAHLLLALKERFGTVNDDGELVIQLPLSRQDIAAMIGTRPETVARAILGLTQDEVASFQGRTVVVPDLDALLNEVDETGV
jgi:CRP-like cAMP-binding protein